MILDTIDKQVDVNEKILWQGTPKKNAYILSKCLVFTPVALLWLCFDGTFLGVLFTQTPVLKDQPYMLFFLIPFFFLHLAPVWIWLYKLLRANLEHKNVAYAITDRRVIISKGVSNVTHVSMNFCDLVSATFKVNAIDRKLGVGDITLTGNGMAMLFDVPDVQRVHALLMEQINKFAAQRAQSGDISTMSAEQLRLMVTQLRSEDAAVEMDNKTDFSSEGESAFEDTHEGI